MNSGTAGIWFGLLLQLDKYLVGFCGVFLIWVIARSMSIADRAREALKTVGDYSFDIYLMHNPYFVAVSAIALNKILGLNLYVTIIVAMLIGIAVPMVISWFVIRRVKWMSSVMAGR